MKSHPLVRSSAPQSTQDRGASFIGDCQKCDRCFSKMYGCTATKCYCHDHPKEAA